MELAGVVRSNSAFWSEPRTPLDSPVQAKPASASTVATVTGANAVRRTLAAFRYRDFRILWLGSCTSSIGTWMQNVAENWLVLSLTGSAFYLGLDAFLQQLPIMLFSLIGGVLADRFDRRKTLLVSQYIQMTTAFTLAVLVFFGLSRVWPIMLLSFITGRSEEHTSELQSRRDLVCRLLLEKKK